jgi:hypothetical protein
MLYLESFHSAVLCSNEDNEVSSNLLPNQTRYCANAGVDDRINLEAVGNTSGVLSLKFE